MRALLIMALFGLLAACSPANPAIEFVPSKKSSLELRAAQIRLIPGDPDTVMRGVIATLHDLGYRITKAEPDAGTVSATRQTALRMAVAVRRRSPVESVVRANATIFALLKEAQVDSSEFYRDDFFIPLGATLHRELAFAPEEMGAPDPIRPSAELNTNKEREAAAAHRASGPGTPAGTNAP
jgi:hypothetical protein